MVFGVGRIERTKFCDNSWLDGHVICLYMPINTLQCQGDKKYKDLLFSNHKNKFVSDRVSCYFICGLALKSNTN